MNYVQRGLYRDLLDEQWENGSVSGDIEDMADICDCPVDVMASAWQVLCKCFTCAGGCYKNDFLEQQRTDKDAERIKRQMSGRLGGVAKAQRNQDESSKCQAGAKQILAPSQDKIRLEEIREEENTPLTPPASGGRKKKCLNYEDDENFTYFWDQYRMPEGREKGSKKKAFAEWRNLSLTHQEYAFYMLDIYLAETNKNDNGRYRKQVYLYLKDRLWEQFDVPESIRKKITNDGGSDE